MRGSFEYANTRGTIYQTAPTKRNRTLAVLIPLSNSLHKRSRTVNWFVKNGKANFGSPIEGNPKYSGQRKPKWILHLTATEISGIFGIMKTPAVFMCWCTVAWHVRLWKFFLSFFISSNRPRSIYKYCNMAPRLSGQTSIFGVVVSFGN